MYERSRNAAAIANPQFRGSSSFMCVCYMQPNARVRLRFHMGFLQAEANGVLTDPPAPNAWNWGSGRVVVVRRASTSCYWLGYMYNASSVLAWLLISRQARLVNRKHTGHHCAKAKPRSKVECSKDLWAAVTGSRNVQLRVLWRCGFQRDVAIRRADCVVERIGANIKFDRLRLIGVKIWRNLATPSAPSLKT